MRKYLIEYNYGFGDEDQVIEANSYGDAMIIAEEACMDGAVSQMSYDAKELTKELAEEYGYEHELDGDK